MTKTDAGKPSKGKFPTLAEAKARAAVLEIERNRLDELYRRADKRRNQAEAKLRGVRIEILRLSGLLTRPSGWTFHPGSLKDSLDWGEGPLTLVYREAAAEQVREMFGLGWHGAVDLVSGADPDGAPKVSLRVADARVFLVGEEEDLLAFALAWGLSIETVPEELAAVERHAEARLARIKHLRASLAGRAKS
jgi:hypothetical protein